MDRFSRRWPIGGRPWRTDGPESRREVGHDARHRAGILDRFVFAARPDLELGAALMELPGLRDPKFAKQLHGAQTFDGTPGDAVAHGFRLKERHIERRVVGDDHIPGQSGQQVVADLAEGRGAGEVRNAQPVDPAPQGPIAWIHQSRPLVDWLSVRAEPNNGNLDDPISDRMEPSCLDVDNGPMAGTRALARRCRGHSPPLNSPGAGEPEELYPAA